MEIVFNCIHERPSQVGGDWRWFASVCASIRNDENGRRRILSDNSAGNLRQCDMPNSCAARILRRNEISSAHNTMRSPRTYIYLLCVCTWMRCVGHHVDFLRLHIVSSCPYLFTFLPRFFSLDSLSISRLVTSFGIYSFLSLCRLFTCLAGCVHYRKLFIHTRTTTRPFDIYFFFLNMLQSTWKPCRLSVLSLFFTRNMFSFSSSSYSGYIYKTTFIFHVSPNCPPKGSRLNSFRVLSRCLPLVHSVRIEKDDRRIRKISK